MAGNYAAYIYQMQQQQLQLQLQLQQQQQQQQQLQQPTAVNYICPTGASAGMALTILAPDGRKLQVEAPCS